MTRGSGIIGHIHPILGSIRSVPIPAKPGEEPPKPREPFITISRQPGAGGWSQAKHLVDALNEAIPGDREWSCWDKELVEKIAADLKLSAPLIESLEDRGRSWLTDFFESLSSSDSAGSADASRVYTRVAASIRALAQTGRVVIVGRGGVFITRRMPGGIHVRLVAPFEQRVAFMSKEYQLAPDKAAARIKELERNRQAFYRYFWPNENLGPETFTVTINTAEVDLASAIAIMTTLVRQQVAAAKSSK